MRHMDVAAPLDAAQAGLAHQGDDLGGRELAKRDRDETGMDHARDFNAPPSRRQAPPLARHRVALHPIGKARREAHPSSRAVFNP